MTKTKKSKAGRKPKALEDKNVATITARIPGDLYAALQKQVAASGKKQSDIIRFYLQQAILEKDMGADFYVSDSAQGLALLIGTLVGDIEKGEQQFWTDCSHTYQVVVAAIQAALLELAPLVKQTSKRIKPTEFENNLNLIPDSLFKEYASQFIATRDNPMVEGLKLGRGFISQLEITDDPAMRNIVDDHIHHARHHYVMPKIKRKIASKKWRTK